MLADLPSRQTAAAKITHVHKKDGFICSPSLTSAHASGVDPSHVFHDRRELRLVFLDDVVEPVQVHRERVLALRLQRLGDFRELVLVTPLRADDVRCRVFGGVKRSANRNKGKEFSDNRSTTTTTTVTMITQRNKQKVNEMKYPSFPQSVRSGQSPQEGMTTSLGSPRRDSRLCPCGAKRDECAAKRASTPYRVCVCVCMCGRWKEKERKQKAQRQC